MASKRPSVVASGLLARPGSAPARTTELQDLPRTVAEPAPAVERSSVTNLPLKPAALAAEPEPAERSGAQGIKAATRGNTLYLLHGEHKRLRRLAADWDTSVHDMMLDGLDLLLAQRGEAPLERYSPPKTKKG